MQIGHFKPVVMLLVLLLAATAQAAFLVIDDSVEGQITLAHDPNWTFGVTSNGVPFPGRVAGSTIALGESATFSGRYFVNIPGTPDPGSGIIYFVDAANPNLVSDIVTASWSTVVNPGPAFDITTISFNIQSSACGFNLGALPAQFAGLGVTDPNGTLLGLQGLFRDPATALAVTIPSNLGIAFVGSATSCLAVDIDIKFCSDPNAFNCKKKGKTPVTIFGNGLDVIDIDIPTLRLCLASAPATCTANGPQSFSTADRGDPTTDVGADSCAVIDNVEQDFLNPDGKLDLDVAFDSQEVVGLIGCGGLNRGDVSGTLILTGQTLGGTPIESIPIGDPGIDQLVIKNK